MHESFVETLMVHIMEATMITKAQIERVLGPILGMFIEDVLTETFREDPDLSGSIAMICPEFPLKKQDDRQSTNIDWLMYNIERRQLLFVELKTSDMFDVAHQSEIFHSKQKDINYKGGSFLIEDLEQVKGASPEYGKYQYISEKKVSQWKNEISECHDAKIIYLVPKCAEHKVQGYADKVLTFGMLSNSPKGPFAKEWAIIRGHLCSLDDLSQHVRNRRSAYVAKTKRGLNFTDHYVSKMAGGVNFADRSDFRSIIELCRKMGDEVIVGFMGGEIALITRDIASLENRIYKWDHAIGGTGIKDSRNWIRGSVFFRIINEKSKLTK